MRKYFIYSAQFVKKKEQLEQKEKLKIFNYIREIKSLSDINNRYKILL